MVDAFLPDLEWDWVGHQQGGGLYLLAPELAPGRHRVNYVGISKDLAGRLRGYVTEVLEGGWPTCDYSRFWQGARTGVRAVSTDEFRQDPRHVREAWHYLQRCPVFIEVMEPYEKSAAAAAFERTIIHWLRRDPDLASYLSNRDLATPAGPVELQLAFPDGRWFDGLDDVVSWPAEDQGSSA